MARLPRQGAPAVAEDGRGLWPGPAPVPDLPHGPSRRGAGYRRDRRPETPRHPLLPGGAPAPARAEPLADAPARGLALLRAASRTGGARHRLGFFRDPQPEARPHPAAAALRRGGGRGDGGREPRRRGSGALDPRPRRGGSLAPLRLGPAHLGSPRPEAARRPGRRHRRRDGDRQGRQDPLRAGDRADPRGASKNTCASVPTR